MGGSFSIAKGSSCCEIQEIAKIKEEKLGLHVDLAVHTGLQSAVRLSLVRTTFITLAVIEKPQKNDE